MIVSRSTLSIFVPEIKTLSVDDLVSLLFKSGIEVEGYEFLKMPTGIHYGTVKSTFPVKGSSKLNFCEVYVFDKGIYEIVCGGSNVEKNMNVVVALPGSSLREGEFKIEERMIMGIKSCGMICSYFELFKTNLISNVVSDGSVINLGDDWNVNKLINSEDLFLDDYILDLTIPVNREDLKCIFGIAKELKKLGNFDPKNIKLPNFLPNSWILKQHLLQNNIGLSKDPFQNQKNFIDLCYGTVFDKDDLLSSKENFQCFLLNISELSKFIGLDKNTIEEKIKYLEYYDFSIVADSKNSEKVEYKISVPYYRNDIKSSRDIFEEIIKLTGIENSLSLPPSLKFLSYDNKEILAIQKIKEFWRNRGFYECTTFNLSSPKYFLDGIKVENAQSSERSVLRDHALYELIDVIDKSYRRKHKLIPVFEIFKSFKYGWVFNFVVPESDFSFPLNKTYISNDLRDVQSLLSRSFKYLDSHLIFKSSNSSISPFYKENLISINNNQGFIGFLDSSLPFRSIGGWVILSKDQEKSLKIQTPSIYPVVFRDISFSYSPQTSNDLSLKDTLDSLKTKHLINIRVIENYSAENIDKYLIRCSFQSDEKTLLKNEVESEIVEIVNILESKNFTIH